MLGYGIAGLGLVALFQREIAASRPVATLLAAGAALAGFAIGVDTFATQGSLLADLEHPARIMAVGSVFAAFLLKYREMAPALLANASAARASTPVLQRTNGALPAQATFRQQHCATC